jgi:hypothetical protein
MAAGVTFLRSLPVVEVEWEDATATGGWQDLRDIKGEPAMLQKVRTVGYLCRSDAQSVVLAQNVSDSDKGADTMAIPKSCVKRIRRLAPAERGG